LRGERQSEGSHIKQDDEVLRHSIKSMSVRFGAPQWFGAVTAGRKNALDESMAVIR
jgi:hypothetical protein